MGRVFPARAGMNRIGREDAVPLMRSRTRGDEPSTNA